MFLDSSDSLACSQFRQRFFLWRFDGAPHPQALHDACQKGYATLILAFRDHESLHQNSDAAKIRESTTIFPRTREYLLSHSEWPNLKAAGLQGLFSPCAHRSSVHRPALQPSSIQVQSWKD